MTKQNIFKILIIIITLIGILWFAKSPTTSSSIPLVAIASYGPHPSLTDSINGLKNELTKEGFIENKNIRYEITDVSFNTTLIPQMITKLTSDNPSVLVVLTTPVAQFAKNAVKNIPLVYVDVTDPVAAGLIKNSNQADGNMTGSSEKQNLVVLLQFAKKLIPNAKTIGILYSTSESNDAALVKMMKDAAHNEGMEVLAVPIDESRDIPTRMQAFEGKADFIYVGTSGPIQPALPVIVSEANKMKIPVFNADENEVKNGLVLASFGVDYKEVGANGGKLVAAILRGTPVDKLNPLYPTLKDHHAFINKKVAANFGITIPENLQNITLID